MRHRHDILLEQKLEKRMVLLYDTEKHLNFTKMAVCLVGDPQLLRKSRKKSLSSNTKNKPFVPRLVLIFI